MPDNGGATRLDDELTEQQIEEKVRAEYEQQDQDERSEERVVLVQALTIWRWIFHITLVVVGLPLFGLVLGFAVALFRWASGLW